MKNYLLLVFSLFIFQSGIACAKSIEGKVVSVSDGDTIKILTQNKKQIKIRFAQIDTPEKKQPWGKKAKTALSEKIAGKKVQVEIETTDRYGRKVGTVWYSGRDINREMVREGHAWVYRRYVRDQSLFDDETYAQSNNLGLWSLPESQRQEPWEWRKSKRSNR
jgi:endonuclease YncB( thermonuclease family)